MAEHERQAAAPPQSAPRFPTKSWRFPRHFPQTGGKVVAARYPTAAEERDIRVAMDSNFAGEAMAATTGRDRARRDLAVDVKIRIAQDCIVSFDGHAVKDDEREDLWAEKFDGGARDELLQWVAHCMAPVDPEDEEGLPGFLR